MHVAFSYGLLEPCPISRATCSASSSQNIEMSKMDPPVAIPFKFYINYGKPTPEDGTMVSVTVSGKTFHFRTSGSFPEDRQVIREISREHSMLMRGADPGCAPLGNYVDSCEWLQCRIHHLNRLCLHFAAKHNDEWANTGGFQTTVQPALDFVKGEGGATPHAAVVMAASILEGDRSFFL
jgi:hypothetical protein